MALLLKYGFTSSTPVMRAGDTKRYSCFPQWRVNTGWDASPFFKRSAYVLNPRPASRPPSRPFHGVPYFASRFARTAGRTGPVIPSPLPTAHETRGRRRHAPSPPNAHRSDLIVYPAHCPFFTSFRASSATCVRMCGGPSDHARASGGTLPQQILETRTSPGRGSALRLQCSPCPE